MRSLLKFKEPKRQDAEQQAGTSIEALQQEVRRLSERQRELEQTVNATRNDINFYQLKRQAFIASRPEGANRFERIITGNAFEQQLQRLDAHIAALQDSLPILTSEQQENAHLLDTAKQKLSAIVHPEIERRLTEMLGLLNRAMELNDQIENAWWNCAEAGFDLNLKDRRGDPMGSPAFRGLIRPALIMGGQRKLLSGEATPVDRWLSGVRERGFQVGGWNR